MPNDHVRFISGIQVNTTFKSNGCTSLFSDWKIKKKKKGGGEKNLTISIIVEKVFTKIQHSFLIFKISHHSSNKREFSAPNQEHL